MKLYLILLLFCLGCNQDYSPVYIEDVLNVECNMKIKSIEKPTQYTFITGENSKKKNITIYSTFYYPIVEKLKVGDYLLKRKNENIFYIIKSNTDTVKVEYTLRETSLCVDGITIWP